MEQEPKQQGLFTKADLHQIFDVLDEINRAKQAGTLKAYIDNVQIAAASQGHVELAASETAQVIYRAQRKGMTPSNPILFDFAVAIFEANKDKQSHNL